MLDILRNKHFLQIASLLSVAQSPGWRMRHREMKSVRATLDELAKYIHGGSEAFNSSETLKTQFYSTLTLLLADIVMQDVKLHYDQDDATWIVESLFSNQAAVTFSMLFAVSVSQQHWYSAEEVATFSGEAAGTWKNRAANNEVYAVERAGLRTWIFPELALRAFGVNVPNEVLKIESEE